MCHIHSLYPPPRLLFVYLNCAAFCCPFACQRTFATSRWYSAWSNQRETCTPFRGTLLTRTSGCGSSSEVVVCSTCLPCSAKMGASTPHRYKTMHACHVLCIGLRDAQWVSKLTRQKHVLLLVSVNLSRETGAAVAHLCCTTQARPSHPSPLPLPPRFRSSFSAFGLSAIFITATLWPQLRCTLVSAQGVLSGAAETGGASDKLQEEGRLGR